MNLSQCIGLGVAGNFAKHLEQAGESKDFVNVAAAEGAPKGIFPFYLPNHDSFLATYPLSSQTQIATGTENPQLEPEVALYCELSYLDGKVSAITPLKFAAFNDCTVRKEGASKISQKKNWGEASKGVSDQWLDLDKFERGGVLDNYNLASFVTRDGVTYPYGVDTELLGYSYFYQQLMDWLLDKINHQQDQGPLENISELLTQCNQPSHAIISIGATAYEEFGENNYLEAGDKITVVTYPNTIDNIKQCVEIGTFPEQCSVLQQEVK
jgi:hypothetical protein